MSVFGLLLLANEAWANHAVQAVGVFLPFMVGALALTAAVLIVLIVLFVLFFISIVLATINLFWKNRVMHIVVSTLGIITTFIYTILLFIFLKGGGDPTFITLFMLLFWGIWYATKKKIKAKRP
jgi:hypothetical protein